MATISTVVTKGYGVGTVSEVVWLGYGSTAGVADAPTIPAAVVLEGGGTLSWHDAVDAAYRKRHLQAEIQKATKELRKVEAKIKTVEKKLRSGRTEGILANYHLLEMKKDEIRNTIRGFKLELVPLELWIKKQQEDEEDEKDIEMLLLS